MSHADRWRGAIVGHKQFVAEETALYDAAFEQLSVVVRRRAAEHEAAFAAFLGSEDDRVARELLRRHRPLPRQPDTRAMVPQSGTYAFTYPGRRRDYGFEGEFVPLVETETGQIAFFPKGLRRLGNVSVWRRGAFFPPDAAEIVGIGLKRALKNIREALNNNRGSTPAESVQRRVVELQREKAWESDIAPLARITSAVDHLIARHHPKGV